MAGRALIMSAGSSLCNLVQHKEPTFLQGLRGEDAQYKPEKYTYVNMNDGEKKQELGGVDK